MKKTYCDCGEKKDYRAKNCMKCRNKKYNGTGNPNFCHGHTIEAKQSKEYMIWNQIIRRCYKKDHPQYNDYGGSGIKVCKRWHNFKNFFQDMGKKPDGLTIERINNNRSYSKQNCKWKNRKSQNLNRRNFKNKTSKFKGVYWDKKAKKWAVSMTVNKKSYWGGYYPSEKDALNGYNDLKNRVESLIN